MAIDLESLIRSVKNCNLAFNLLSNPFEWDPSEFEVLATEIVKNPNITTMRFRNLDVSPMEEKEHVREKIVHQIKRVAGKFGLIVLEAHIPFTEANLSLLRSMVLVTECTLLAVGQMKSGNVPLSIQARHTVMLSEMLQSASKFNRSGGPKTVAIVGTFSADGFNQFCIEIPKLPRSIKGLSIRSTLQARHNHSKLFEALENSELESIRLMFNKLTYQHGVSFAKTLSAGLGKHLQSINLNVAIGNDGPSNAPLTNTPSLRAFAEVLDGLSDCPRLVHLAITPFSVEVCKGLPKLKTLQHLDLSGCHTKEMSCELLASCLPELYGLEVLEVNLPPLDKRDEDFWDLKNCVTKLRSLRNLIFYAFDYDGCCAMLDGLALVSSMRRLRFSYKHHQPYRCNVKDISVSLYKLLKSSGITELQCPLYRLSKAYPVLEGFLQREARLISVMDMFYSNENGKCVQFNKNVATRCKNYLIESLRTCFPQIPLAVAKVLALYVGTIIFDPFYDLDYYVA